MYKCGHCNQLFYSTVDCSSHVETAHSDAEAKTDACVEVHYQCPTCAMIFRHWVDCRNHALREHGQQRVKCYERSTSP